MDRTLCPRQQTLGLASVPIVLMERSNRKSTIPAGDRLFTRIKPYRPPKTTSTPYLRSARQPHTVDIFKPQK